MTSTSSSTNEPRKKLQKSNTVDLANLNLRDSEDSESTQSQSSHDTHHSHPVRHDSSDADLPHSHKNSRKSKLWGNRISSLLPSIMSNFSDHSSSSSISTSTSAPAMTSTTTTTTAPAPAPTVAAAPPAPTIPAPAIPPPAVPAPTIPAPAPLASAPITTKPIESSTGRSSPASTINDSVSTPSLRVTEPPTSSVDEFENTLGIQSQLNQETKHDSAPQLSLSESDFSSISMEVTSPQIKAIPPSPEMKRTTLHKDPPPQINTTVSPPESTSGDSLKGGKLQKTNPNSRRRSGSLQHAKQDSLHSLKTRQSIPINEDRGRRSVSAQVPATKRDSASGTRITSTPLNPRPLTPNGDPSQSPTRGRIRRSWMPGGRSRSNSIEVSGNTANVAAWVISDDTRAEYNASFLKNAEKVPELWNEGGDVYVHLYPRASGCGPSFKIPEFTISSSYVFNELIQTERETPTPTGRSRARSFGGRASLSVEDATRYVSPPSSPPLPDTSYETKLYLPTAPPSGVGQLAAPGQGAQQEMERLIAIRNLFAFLTGQPLVATKLRPTNFHAFVQIADLLEEFGFTSMDGTTFGDAVDLSFGFYMDQLGLADCRHSREKTLEALILGERMRNLDLYSEAFAHATGKYSAIMDLRLPLFEQLSKHTRVGLERAHLDLVNRQHNVNVHLEQFEFPALFAGIANSTSIPELRHVGFKTWRQSFGRMRQFVMSHYKSTFGSWPPKASSKKNPFAESGLNRLVLKVLYSDMCSLYDLLVDRTNLTSRVMDEVPSITEDVDKMLNSALRNVMSEFDRSKPPVLPPVPYDCPQLPTPTSVHAPYNSLSAKDQAKFDKKIKDHELRLILNKAYNYDTSSLKSPFLDQFKEFEIREGRGKGSQELVDQRIGYWLFLYVVIQSLPVLVVDAPGMKFTEGVEYFLCQPPMGNPPWSGDKQVRKMWYEVAGGGGLVELSTDAVLFSIEATYHRSHCWMAAKQWEGHTGNEILPPPPTEPALSPLQPPRSVFSTADDFVQSPSTLGVPGTPSPPLGGPQVALRPRTHSPGGSRANQAWRSSIALGLEPVPLEPPQLTQFPDRRSSLGIRGPSPFGSRSSSMGNLAAMGAREFKPETPPPEAATSGATFDDILGDEAAKPAPTPKKKGRFF